MTRYFICRAPRHRQARLIDQGAVRGSGFFRPSLLSLESWGGDQCVAIDYRSAQATATVEVRVGGALEATVSTTPPRPPQRPQRRPQRRPPRYWDDEPDPWTVPLPEDRWGTGPAEIRVAIQMGLDGYVVAAIDGEVVDDPPSIEIALSGWRSISDYDVLAHIADEPDQTQDQTEASVVRYMTWYGLGDACTEPRNVQRWAGLVAKERERRASV